jgi:hypothetical protein
MTLRLSYIATCDDIRIFAGLRDASFIDQRPGSNSHPQPSNDRFTDLVIIGQRLAV